MSRPPPLGTSAPVRPRLDDVVTGQRLTGGSGTGASIGVGGESGIGDGRPGEPFPHTLAARVAEPSSEIPIGEQPLERGAQGGYVARRYVEPRNAVRDKVEQATDRARDDRAAVCHRLGADDAEAFPVRRHRDDSCAFVETQQFLVRDEPARARHPLAQRSVPDDDEGDPVGSRHELETSLLRRETACKENERWLVLLADVVRNVHAARDHLHSSRAESARRAGQNSRRRHHNTSPPQDPARKPRHAPRELDVGPPDLRDYGLARQQGHGGRGQPVRVDEIGAARGAHGGDGEREQEQRQQEREPGAAAEVSDDPRAVGEAEVRKVGRRDHLDVEPSPAQPLHRVGDEAPRGVTRLAGVGRGQDDDSHGGSLCSTTIGQPHGHRSRPVQGRDGGPLRGAGRVLRPVRERGVPLEAPEQHVPPADRPADALSRARGRPRARDRLGLGRPARRAQAERRRRRRRLAGDGRPLPQGPSRAPLRAHPRRAAGARGDVRLHPALGPDAVRGRPARAVPPGRRALARAHARDRQLVQPRVAAGVPARRDPPAEAAQAAAQLGRAARRGQPARARGVRAGAVADADHVPQADPVRDDLPERLRRQPAADQHARGHELDRRAPAAARARRAERLDRLRLQERAGPHSRADRPRARLRRVDGADLRRGQLDGRHARRDPAADRGPPRARHQLHPADRQGQGRRRPHRLRSGEARRADDPRRGSQRPARGPAEVPPRPGRRSRRARQRVAPRLRHGAGRDALPEHDRQPHLRAAAQGDHGPAGQGHAVRDEGAPQAGLRADRGRAFLLRRVRPVRRLRPALRRGQARGEDRRPAGALPPANVRRDEHQPLAPRRAAPSDDALRVLEVQGRTADTPRSLSRTVDRLWSERWAALAAAAVVAVAAVVVTAQPIDSPWWTYADADASYTASALNLVLGEDVTFVDHPGLPLTEAAAIVFGADTLLEEGSLSGSARLAFVDRALLDLDSTRWVFRGLSGLVYLLGALLSFLFAARLFGHWTWGLAAGLLWVAAPGLTAMSIQFRPDVPLAVLTLVFGFTVARAVERRSVEWYAAAAATVGFAAMVKLHALALLPALVVAALWRPADASDAWVRLRGWVRQRRALVASIAGAWLLVALLLNGARLPWDVTPVQLGVLAALAAVVAASVAVAELLVRPFYGWLVAAFAAGLLLPVTLDIPDGLRALHYIVRAISGQGVQEGVDSFATPLSSLDSIVGREAVIAFLLAGVAGVVGFVRRDPL